MGAVTAIMLAKNGANIVFTYSKNKKMAEDKDITFASSSNNSHHYELSIGLSKM